MLAIQGYFARGRCSLNGESIVINGREQMISSLKQCNSFRLGIIGLVLTLIVLFAVLSMILFSELYTRKLAVEDIDMLVLLTVLLACAVYFANFLRYGFWWIVNGELLILLDGKRDAQVDQQFVVFSGIKSDGSSSVPIRLKKRTVLKWVVIWVVVVSTIVLAFNEIMKLLHDPLGDRMCEIWFLLAFISALTSAIVQFENIKWKD